MSLYELSIGDKRLVVDPDKISNSQVIDIRKKFAHIRKQFMTATKYPQLENETSEEWEARIEQEEAKKSKIQEGESIAEYIDRVMEPNLDIMDLAKKTLFMLAHTFDQADKVTEETWDKVSWSKTKAFIRLILLECDDSSATLFE